MTLRHAAAGRPAAGDDDLDGYDDFDDFEDDEDVDAIDGEDEIDDDFDYDEDDEDEETFDDPEDDAYYVSLRRGTRPDSGTRAAPVRRTGAAPPS